MELGHHLWSCHHWGTLLSKDWDLEFHFLYGFLVSAHWFCSYCHEKRIVQQPRKGNITIVFLLHAYMLSKWKVFLDDGHMDGQHYIWCQEALRKFHCKDILENDLILMVGTWYKVNLESMSRWNMSILSNILDEDFVLSILYGVVTGEWWLCWIYI
jgi:hypothetical protein